MLKLPRIEGHELIIIRVHQIASTIDLTTTTKDAH
jgi:hypothetical protein